MYEQKQIFDGDALVREAINYLESQLGKPGREPAAESQDRHTTGNLPTRIRPISLFS